MRPTPRWRSARPNRVDVVSIVTPNHMHHGPAKALLQAGFHVICDKPLCRTLDDALDLEPAARSSPGLFALTNYTGYPMVRHAAARRAASATSARTLSTSPSS